MHSTRHRRRGEGRRAWALVLAASLMLSATACGSGGMSKEEMLEEAGACDFSAIRSGYQDNQVNDEETYCGQVCQFAGYVETIGETSVKVVPLEAPVGATPSTAYDLALEVTLSEEDIRQLSTFAVVRMVGEVSALEAHTVYMEDAYYLDDQITFTGTVEGFALNGGFKQTTIVSDMALFGGDPVTFRYVYMGESVDLSQPGAFDAFEEETIRDVTLREGDTVTVTGKLTYETTSYLDLGGGLYAHTRELRLTQVDAIEKA